MPDKNTNYVISEIQQEYRKIDHQWLTLHFRTIIGIIVIGLIIEFVLAYVFYAIAHQTIEISFEHYISKFVLKPFVINTGWLIASIFVMYWPDLRNRTRVYLLSIILIGVCFVFYSVHYIFHIAMIFSVPIVFTAFYGDYTLTSVISVLTILTKLFSDFYIVWDTDKMHPFSSGHNLMVVIVSTLLLISFYAISVVMISFQRKKNNAVIQIETDRINMHQQLITDTLTGISNRLALRNMFDSIENSSSDTYHFAMIDIDEFKELNDTLGHTKGDYCLEQVGAVLHKYSSDDILPFRFGGDEFCILFKNQTENEVYAICNTIRLECNKEIFEKLYNRLSLSIGIAKYEQDMFAEDLLNAADQAMYRAKNQKNAISF